MTKSKISRRDALAWTGILAGATVVGKPVEAATASDAPLAKNAAQPFRLCLNTATIREYKLGIVKEIEVVAQSGYEGFEPWIDSLGNYVKDGGKLGDLKKRIVDSGLAVEGAIGFPEWIVDDDARRAKGMEQAKREMEMVAQIGGKRFAAPPAGATDLPRLDLVRAAERYRALLEAGEQIGVVPQLELWGFSKNLSRLGECIAVAMETGHHNACVLADVFHLYKGGSEFRGMHLLGSNAIHVLHMNDYPNEPTRDKINDSYRIYPGDGTAPLIEILRTLQATGGSKVLSLELFNHKYQSQDVLTVAKTGLSKMKAVLEKARI